MVHAKTEPLVIAVVDDAFRVSHEMFDGLRWQNPKEIPNNGIDDDGNGYVDDIYGWDVSDQDGELLPPNSRASEFAHGTNMAGIIADTLRQHFGDQLAKQQDSPVKLMFVKAVADTATQVNLKDGYKGIDYALKNGADIISLSWGGGKFTDEAKEVLGRARQQGVIVLASMGTYPQKDASYPSAHAGVIGIAGVDDTGKIQFSNYGEEVDLVASSMPFMAADVKANNAYTSTKGVSNGVAVVAAQVAILKANVADLNHSDARRCLMSTAIPQDLQNPDQAGKLGAGRVNLDAALSCAANIGSAIDGERSQAKGSIYYERKKNKNKKTVWQLRPIGNYKGLSLKPYVQGKSKKTEVRVISQADQAVIWQGLANELPPSINTQATSVDIELISKTKANYKFGMSYATQNIEFSERYCQGKVLVTEPTIIEDGSGDLNYAANSSCYWLIKPKEGFDIGLTFTELDTEIHTDGIQLFRGNSTQQTNSLMRITGSELPNKIVVQQSEVLLWFVSNDSVSGQGFKVKVSHEARL